jgi:two-component system OmpR family sensor kinase
MFKQTGRSILTQTFWLLVGALIVAQGVGFASFYLLPPPRQEGVSMRQIVQRLREEDGAQAKGGPILQVIHQAEAPRPENGLCFTMTRGCRASSPPRLGASPQNVRIYYRSENVRIYYRPDRFNQPARERSAHRRGEGRDDGVVRWRGEPFFYARTVAAARIGDDWRVVHTPDRPLIAAWQQRTAIVFVMALIALLPLAWLFARQLVKPIQRLRQCRC